MGHRHETGEDRRRLPGRDRPGIQPRRPKRSRGGHGRRATEVFDAASPLFRTFASRSFYLGSYGAGARMKLVANLALGLHRAVLAETLTFAQACGVSPSDALQVLKAGAAYSRVMDDKGEKMLNHDFSVEAKLSQHLKDVRLILAEAAAKRAKTPLSQLHRQLLERLDAAGYGDLDKAPSLWRTSSATRSITCGFGKPLAIA